MTLAPFYDGFPSGDDLTALLDEIDRSGEADAALDAGGEEGLARYLYLRLFVHTRTHLALIGAIQSAHVDDEVSLLISCTPLLSTSEKLAMLSRREEGTDLPDLQRTLEDAEHELYRISRDLATRLLATMHTQQSN